MSKYLFTVLLAFSIFSSEAQESGMQFQHSLSWDNVLAKAKQENKYIFVDCYATWCGPCKKMAKEVFVLPSVGDFYNAHFVNVKAQMDSSSKDDEATKARYADNHQLLAKYGIQAYPTYLIFNPSGEIVSRFVGYLPEEQFISQGKNVLQPEKQYYTQLRKFEAGDRNPEFLYELANMTTEAMDSKNQKIVGDAYLATQTNLYTKDNLNLLFSITNSVSNKGFPTIMNNQPAIDAVLGKGAAHRKVIYILMNDQVLPSLPFAKADSNAAAPDWTKLQNKLNSQYPAYAAELVSLSKVIFFRYNQQWKNFGHAVCEYMRTYGSGTTINEKNDYAWTVFEKCRDINQLNCTLEWAKALSEADCAGRDTYANLLYSTGRKKEAIEIEKKALEMAKAAGDPNLSGYEKTLKDMESNP